MNDLISRQAAIDTIDKYFDDLPIQVYYDMVRIIENSPAVDAVPVVRCKDCKYYRAGVKLSPQKFCFRLRGRDGEAIGYNFSEDDFCSYGERSEDDQKAD